jgi:hypothetical protein
MFPPAPATRIDFPLMVYASGIQLNPASSDVGCGQKPHEGAYVQQGSLPVW